MPEDLAYPGQADLMGRVELAARRRAVLVGQLLSEAFGAAVVRRELTVILLDTLDDNALAEVLYRHPGVLKPLLLVANVASRALDRDLGLRNLDTYQPRLPREEALKIAVYLRPFLPKMLPTSALVELDRVAFVDKEIRKAKGGWERQVRDRLVRVSNLAFKKAKFTVQGESFELDAAYPTPGEIQLAVDIKRIEARRDIHKRCDEIVNKAEKFKQVNPEGKFAAIIYYPFVAEHDHIRSRLKSPNIEVVAFASESKMDMELAAKILSEAFGLRAAQPQADSGDTGSGGFPEA